jgi:hypothetical protein
LRTYLDTGTASQASLQLHHSPGNLIAHGDLALMMVLRLGPAPATLSCAMGGGWSMSGSGSRAVTGSCSLGLDRLGTGIGAL